MRSFGMSKFKLLMPFLIVGILISGSLYSLGNNLIPYSKRKFRHGVIQMTSKGLLADIRPEKFFIDIPGITIFAQNVQDDGSILKDVFIYSHKNKGNINEDSIIFAKRGQLIKNSEEMEISSVRMLLEDGNISKIDRVTNDIEKIFFQKYDFPITSIGNNANYVTKDDMRTSSELRKIINENKRQGRKDSGAMKSSLEYYSRLNAPLQCVIFIFLGFSLGIKRGRESSSNTGQLGFLSLIIYYVLFFFGLSFAKKGNIPAEVAIFLPSVIIFMMATWFYKKIDWVG